MMKKRFKILCPVMIFGAFFMQSFTAYAEAPEETIESSVILESAEIPVIPNEISPIPDTEDENPVSIPVESAPDYTEPDSIPKGNGSLIEDVSNEEVNRQFITVKSKGGNVFYIIIDKDSKTENVYFLNAVDEYDLLAFADNFPEEVLAELENESDNADISDTSESNGNKSVQKEAESSGEESENTSSGSSIIILILIAALGISGLVYFKVIKPKQGGKSPKKSVYEDEDEEEYEEDTVNEDDDDEQEDE